jgi:hypothetical protein
MAVPYCIDYFIFVVYFEVREYDVDNFVPIDQDCFGYSGSFVVPCEFED